MVLALSAGVLLQGASGQFGPSGGTLRRIGTGIVAVVVVQFLLGWAALWAVSGDEISATIAEGGAG